MKAESKYILLPLVCALVVSLFWILRFSGYSIEGDGTRLTLAAEGINIEGTIATSRYAYSNGFGYPVLIAFLSSICGINEQMIQLGIAILTLVLVLAAFIVYGDFLGSYKLGAIACTILLLQPDFIFYILRSSHEKITWLCALLLIFFLVRSYKSVESPKKFAVNIILFYLILWSMICSNAYFASSFLFAILLSLLAGRLVILIKKKNIPEKDMHFIKRFIYPLFIGSLLIFIFISYLYRPALSYYDTVGSVINKISILFLGADKEKKITSYLDVIGPSWSSVTIYFLLTIYQWVINILAFGMWTYLGIKFFTKGVTVIRAEQRVLWLLYFGFGVQLVYSVFVDISGSLGSNLILRVFTPFALLSSPLAAQALGQITSFFKVRYSKLLLIGASLLLVLGLIASMLKSNNDPLVSNNWIFSTPDFRAASNWIDTNMKNTDVWLDLTVHQQDVIQFEKGYLWEPANQYTSILQGYNVTHYVLSKQSLMQAQRQKVSLPPILNFFRIYDNGNSWIFFRKPTTLFER